MTKRKRGHPTDYPCHFMRWDEAKNKDVPDVPTVNCARSCASCPWNPEEAKRRMETGEYITRQNGVRTLIFKRRSADAASA